jgi:hypothetical protein
VSDYVTASNGVQLELNALAKTLTYSGGLVTTQTVVFSGKTYVQTYTNNGTQITGVSQWVVQ